MEELSLHILDIAENSITADADRVELIITEDTKQDVLSIEVIDNGRGMDEETAQRALDPFYTTKTVRSVGLGLSLLSEAAKAANGQFSIESEVGRGTRIKAIFQLSHIDRQPLGDIDQTIITLVVGNPEIDIVFTHRKNKREYSLDTGKIKDQLGQTPIGSLAGIRMLKEHLKKGFK
ncbi:ATP-binding protein [Acidobacteriota bacterium]